jgi:hypothetical protein
MMPPQPEQILERVQIPIIKQGMFHRLKSNLGPLAVATTAWRRFSITSALFKYSTR